MENEYNSNEKVANRTLQQIQILWKNIKIQLKKTAAIARRECFKTGGGPPVRPQTDELGELLTGMIESQKPLKGIPDDDHLDSSEQDDLSLNHMLEEPEQSQQKSDLCTCGSSQYLHPRQHSKSEKADYQ
ncbi:hypothetical protein CRENBAI_016470 [Crenichthys baileyi]|uniref:Uncharacterized protein n=1 Tax=Crenichthys baileyi TaxID=28760 RepID=A0AAV9SAV6_9TELE